MDVAEALLDSWDRQCRIVQAVGSRVTEANRNQKPSEDGWPLDRQLAHIHETRYAWLNTIAPELASGLGESFQEDYETPLTDLEAIRAELEKSGAAIREVSEKYLESGFTNPGTYKHPVHFLGHMIWHEGWHVGLMMLALRLAGDEPPPGWEEANIWSEWRIEG